MKMKRVLLPFLLVCLGFLLPAASLFKPAEEPLPPLTSDEISAEALFRRFTEEEKYTEYPSWPGHQGEQPGQSPHGWLHRVYINPVLSDALPIEDRRAPEGSIVVKANLDRDRKVESFTVMAKVRGYHPEANDWFWAKYTPGGQAGAAGRVQSCISCHEAVRDNDYIIIYRLDQELPE
ncbi:MAG: cytochrome P460 family protein [Spirochaetota bacterium]